MRELLHHLIGTCGESHLSILTLLSTGVLFIYRDYVLDFIRWIYENKKEL